MPDSYQFSIPIGWDDLTEKVPFALEQRFGLEIAAFATGPGVHDPSSRKKMERGFTSALQDFPHSRSFHGAFIDLSLHSEDLAVASIARLRIERDLETASRLDCKVVVFHTGFNPLVPVRRYEEEFLDRHAVFWPGVADRWPGVTICLENMWEPSPQLFERLMRAIGHPQVRMCLDVAHAHAYGHFAVETWMHRLNGRIAHMHWNDNHGDTDSHLPIGDGNLPWEEVIAATRTLHRAITVVLELKSLPDIRRSLRALNPARQPAGFDSNDAPKRSPHTSATKVR